MRPRDTQRYKVYSAENNAFAGSGLDLPELADLKEYVAHVLSLGRVQASFPELGRRGVEVTDGRRRRTAGGDARGIHMPRHARSRWVVLHELAHTIIQRRYGFYGAAAHGWQYAAAYLLLVRHAMGVEAHDRLKAEFKAHRVRFREPRKRAPLSPERRAALVATLAAAREMRQAA